MKNHEDIKKYVNKDHAKKHKQLKKSKDRNTPNIKEDFKVLMKNGYVIINNLISTDECEQIRNETSQLLNKTGRNSFEGLKTQRIYDVLTKTRVIDSLATHPHILGLMDLIFLPNFLLSQSQIINILAGEQAQTLHFDDGFYRIPRPRQPLGAATIWAIDDFTEKNGATIVIPKSHNWGNRINSPEDKMVSAVMPAGSVLFFLGTTWHGGGENRSKNDRLAVTHQYCEAYMRQQENYLLELSKQTVREMSPELQALVGYSIYPPFMGMVDGQHPLRIL